MQRSFIPCSSITWNFKCMLGQPISTSLTVVLLLGKCQKVQICVDWLRTAHWCRPCLSSHHCLKPCRTSTTTESQKHVTPSEHGLEESMLHTEGTQTPPKAEKRGRVHAESLSQTNCAANTFSCCFARALWAKANDSQNEVFRVFSPGLKFRHSTPLGRKEQDDSVHKVIE